MPLTKEQMEEYELLQGGGLPIRGELIAIRQAAALCKVSYQAVYNYKATRPGRKELGRILWWLIGSVIMLSKSSVIEVAAQKGWIEEVH